MNFDQLKMKFYLFPKVENLRIEKALTLTSSSLISGKYTGCNTFFKKIDFRKTNQNKISYFSNRNPAEFSRPVMD